MNHRTAFNFYTPGHQWFLAFTCTLKVYSENWSNINTDFRSTQQRNIKKSQYEIIKQTNYESQTDQLKKWKWLGHYSEKK